MLLDLHVHVCHVYMAFEVEVHRDDDSRSVDSDP